MALVSPYAVVLELMTRGQQSLAYLTDQFRDAPPQQELAVEILRCCNRVIAALRAGSSGKKRKHEGAAVAAASSPPAMPPRKRPRGAEEPTRVVMSGTTADGFIWRKYGQKEINGRKHPRLYHRCANRHLSCTATRRVQRTHEDHEPAAYEIAYYGEHTCSGAAVAASPAPRPPALVDFGSNAWASVGPAAPAPASERRQVLSWEREMLSPGGWSSSASSAEARFEAQTTHDAAPVEQPCYAPDPVTEFLDGSLDWASVLNGGSFDFGALATLQ